ncbi:transporter [Methylococcus sp. EFPC2]|uniref:SphA family protein n=1 Tax=Methylococcus sp. EFPC2 TaxID=2812648 RepID=UPI0019679ABD|nr:transporter [Methylococcus sp. EFPC2]QSA97778.1 transporter [Methylococcus sp. EFPC2]
MTLLRFKTVIAAATALTAVLPLNPALAIEGGASHYLPGAYNDFGMNLQVPPGFYFRDDLTYYWAQFPDGTTLGRFGAVHLDQDLWLNNFKLAWASDFEVLGARYGAALILPVVFDFNLSGSIQFGPHQVSGRNNNGGIGDIAVAPLSLTWKWGDVHVNLSQFVFLPTGDYAAEKVVNLGLNRWSFETLAGLTWLDADRGHEISFNIGFISNTRNAATDYQSGDELHIDYTVAQYLSEAFGVGVTGYYYTQLSDDKSPLLDRLDQARRFLNLPGVDGYRGEAAGIGPAILYSPEIGGKRVSFIGKWIHEYDVNNRFKGELGMLSVALDF